MSESHIQENELYKRWMEAVLSGDDEAAKLLHRELCVLLYGIPPYLIDDDSKNRNAP